MKKRHVLIAILGLLSLYAAYLIGHYFGGEDATGPVRETILPTPVASVSLPAPRLEPAKPAPKTALVITPVKKAEAKTPFHNAEFSELTTRAWTKLPRMAEIRKKGRRDFHYSPPELTEVAEELGAIGDALEHDPKLVSAGLEFLKKCALAEDVMLAARAVCLRDLKHWSSNTPLDLSVFPESIKRIADSLPAQP